MASNFVDRLSKAVLPGYGMKVPCLVASTAALTLSGLQTIDGITVSSGDRVLAKDQTGSYANGVYVAAGTAWARDADFSGNSDVRLGTFIPVALGTVSAGKLAQVTSTGSGNNGTIIFGTGSSTSDAVSFSMKTITASSDSIIASTNITGNFASTNFNNGTNASSARVWLGNLQWGTFDSTNLTGNIRSTNLNSGTAASTTTFLRGDMTWGTVASVGGGTVTAISHSSGVGGGVITSTGDVGLDFGNLPEITTGGSTQVFVGVYNSSTAAHAKMLPSNLPGVVSDPAISSKTASFTASTGVSNTLYLIAPSSAAAVGTLPTASTGVAAGFRAKFLNGTDGKDVTIACPSTLVTINGSTAAYRVPGRYVAGLTLVTVTTGVNDWSVTEIPAHYVGQTVPHFSDTLPNNSWVWGNGQALNRVTNAGLYAFNSSFFGSSDSSSFNVQDICGRAIFGKDNMGGITAKSRITVTTFSPDGQTLGANGGAQTVTQTAGTLAPHSHALPDNGLASAGCAPSALGGSGAPGVTNFTGSTGSGGAMNKMNPGIIANFIVKA